jgi:hypothetical protein
MDSATNKWFSWVLDKNLILLMILFLLMFLFVPWGGICHVLLIRIELVVCMRAHVCRYVSGYKNRYQNFIRYLRELGDEVRGWKKDLHACSFLESMCVCSTSCWFFCVDQISVSSTSNNVFPLMLKCLLESSGLGFNEL